MCLLAAASELFFATEVEFHNDNQYKIDEISNTYKKYYLFGAAMSSTANTV
jgi:hypothetical protein